MKSIRKNLVIMVKNPRLFYETLSLLKEKDISYTVPKEEHYHCKRNDVVVVDEHSIQNVSGECRKVVITRINQRTLHKLLLFIAEKELYKQLVIGIDPGKQYAYIVLGDGEVIEKGKTDRKEIIEIVKKAMNIPHAFFSVKIGQTKSNIEKAMELATELARKTKANIELVDESRTSKRHEYQKNEKDTDLAAAYRIALKTGYISIRSETTNEGGDS